MRRLATFARRIAADVRGVTVVEFALVAPVFCLLLMGSFDIAHSLYTRAVLQGVLQKTARDSSLESGTEIDQRNKLDEKVRKQVRALVRSGDIDINRRFYRTFAEAADAKPETWEDTNKDGTCNRKERYFDSNANNVWDKDGGNEGQGGAKDATYYTVKLTYTALFPLWRFLGKSSEQVVEASTVLRNQPYNDQGSYGAGTWKNCPQ